MALTFKQDGSVRFVKVENGPKVNEAEQTEAALRAFRETSANDPDDSGPGELCFRIEVCQASAAATAAGASCTRTWSVLFGSHARHLFDACCALFVFVRVVSVAARASHRGVRLKRPAGKVPTKRRR